jgi:hypothetical protein
MIDARQHPLFWRFPLAGTVTVSTGDLPTPYHVYGGHGLLITGHGDAAAVTQAFVDQDVFPVLTSSGFAAMGLFVCSFIDASHGPHLELQAVALCAQTPGQTITDDATAVLATLATRPDLAPFSLHLWNDSAAVVAYNTEYLGLDAALAPGRISLGKRMQFRFDDADGKPLAMGDISKNRLSDLRAIFSLIRQMGLHNVLRMARQPFAQAHLVNRKSAVLPRNASARTITAADQMVVTRFDTKRDRLTLSGPLAAYDFKPLCLEHISPFRFVYLHPDA